MPTICLTMIVKDEGHLIRETLKHLLTYIRFDSWCICDTGSTDNTIEEIEEFFAEQGIPGAIHRHEWKDFGHNRTLAFECAYNTSDYAFVWDADDEIVGEFKLPTELKSDWYRFTFGARGCTQYRRCQLFNNRKKWKYVGVLHECPACSEECGSPQDVLGSYHFVSGRRGARNKDPNKYHKDAMILDKAYHEALARKDDLYKRYAFYCAQSYLCAGDRDNAIEFYKKVLAMDTWSQEQYISCMEIYDAYEHKGKAKEGLYYLVEGFRYDSQRAECVMRLVKYYLNAGAPQIAVLYYNGIKNYYENYYEKDPIQEKLFVKRCDPDFYLPYYMIIVAERIRDLALCAKMFDAIITYKYMGVSAWWIQNTFHNLQFFISHIPKSFEYVQKITSYLDTARSHGILLQDAQNNIMQNYLRSCEESLCRPRAQVIPKEGKKVRVMLTMTTCKRLDLFQKTVRSILTTWTDLDQVDFFFCVDDASSAEDRNTMVAEFPFFTFYMKKGHEKGHRESMNIIWNKLAEVKPQYWIHLEDDWLFFQSRSYVKESIDFLTRYKDQSIHQILFNRNYAETFNDWSINGGISLEPGFFLHSNEPVEGRNCAYWKHYSFRPSMVRTETILGLGDYSTPNTFFEGDYAQRYSEKGYKSAFFDTISCLHIGKLTSDKGGINAYTLNNVSQFKEKKPNTYIVNLERRPDRKKAMEGIFQVNGIDSYSFFKAVDGKSLVVTEEIVRLFRGNDFSNRKGFIGCAMSHYTLWKQLAEDTLNNYYIIYEDDITLCDGYKEKLDGVLNDIEGKDVVYLGFSMLKENSHKKHESADRLVLTDKDTYLGGTFSYIITRSGCNKLLSYIETKGIKHGIDYIMKICPDLSIYNPQPHLVFSEMVETMTSPVDTDIQKDYSSLDLILADSKDDWIFYEGVDSGDNDICHVPGKRVEQLFTIASATRGCVAFNTLGFLKRKVVLPYKPTPYINSAGNGLYVKRVYDSSIKERIVRVKMLCNWCSSEALCAEWNKMSKGGNRWNSIQITSEDTNIDYYVIINRPRAGEVFLPEKTIIFHMEPWCGESWQTWGVKTWGEWARPDPAKFLQVRSHDLFLNTGFWQINKTYTQLKEETIQKDSTYGNIVSSICSSKYFDPGHIKRIDFMKFIEAKGDESVQLHIYNEDNKHEFSSYKGTARPSIDKEKGILPYKYYFMCENNVENNFITEKLWEPILCESLCFYWGCPNVSEYINPLAYVQLDMNDFEGSFQIMRSALLENLWEKRIDSIKKEKQRILDIYNFFPTLEKVILSKNL
jgi:GR25 family glycosyltransferase involved in LPS biosynthesis/tetratricopeptide (TPR) repeat protein